MAPSSQEVLKYVAAPPERAPALKFAGKYQKSTHKLMVS
jgi:hypothetical protein